MNRNRITTGAAVTAAALALWTAPSYAKTIKMTVVSAAPAIVTYVRVAKTKVIPEINRRLKESGKDFRIEWTEAYGSTLAKFDEVFETVEEGIAQFGLILKNFEPSKLPLEQYNYVTPFVDQTPMQRVEMDARIRAKVPQLTGMYAKYNHVYLNSGANHTMQMFTTFPLRTIDDLKGRKIGASGSMGLWLQGTGATWVRSAMIKSFTNIKNGVYDGYPIGVTLAFPFKTYEAAKYMTVVNFGTSSTSALTVNSDTWNDMPKHARRIFRDVAKNYAAWQLRIDDAKAAKFLGIMKKKGVKVSTLADSERRRWAMNMPNIAKDWARRQDKRGLPGTKVIKAFMDEARALKVGILRHWDRE